MNLKYFQYFKMYLDLWPTVPLGLRYYLNNLLYTRQVHVIYANVKKTNCTYSSRTLLKLCF